MEAVDSKRFFVKESEGPLKEGELQGAYEFIEPVRLEVYGTPSPGIIEMIRKIASSGVELSYNPGHIGGYIRPGSG